VSSRERLVHAATLVLRMGLVAMLWALLSAAGQLFEVSPGISFFFPAAAICVLAGAWLGPWGALALLPANYLAPWGAAVGVWPGLLFGLPAAAWALLVALLPPFGGTTGKRSARFVFYGVVSGSLLCSLVGNGALVVTGATATGGAFMRGLWTWWIGDLAAGLALGLPMVVLAAPHRLLADRDIRLWRTWRRSRRDVAVMISLAGLGCLAAWLLSTSTGGSVHWFAVFLVPAIAAASWRGGVGSGVIANGLVSMAYVALVVPTLHHGGDNVIVGLASAYANLILFSAFAALVGVLASTNQELLDQVREQGEAVANGLEDAVGALAAAIELKVKSGDGHVQRVARLSAAIAVEMGFSREAVAVLRRAAILHDVGKVGVPEELLRKPALLTDAERQQLRDYVDLGVQILERVEFLAPVLDVLRFADERWDGKTSGEFPARFGLKGEEIPLSSRIVAASCAFDALTHDRPFRTRLTVEGAIAEVWRNSGRKFDPRVVDAVTRVVREGWDLEGH